MSLFNVYPLNPIAITKASGSRVWDDKGQEYLDMYGGHAVISIGHTQPHWVKRIEDQLHAIAFYSNSVVMPIQEQLAAALNEISGKKDFQLFLCNSGAEANENALKLASFHTGRKKIVAFKKAFHGRTSLAVAATDNPSIVAPVNETNNIIFLPFNDIAALQACFSEQGSTIAAVIIEPIPANNGLLLQDKDFLTFLRNICDQNCTLLIFDEVISGFRVGFEGAAGLYDIKPDIVTYGKIIGGGLPVGAYGASSGIMSYISPEGGVYQAGTLSGNPVAMAAGIAQLSELIKPNFYKNLEAKTTAFTQAIQQFALSNHYPFKVFQIGSIFWFAFTDKEKIQTSNDIDASSMEKFKIMHRELLNRGIYFGPSGYEVGFISAAHSSSDLEQTKSAIFESLTIVFNQKI